MSPDAAPEHLAATEIAAGLLLGVVRHVDVRTCGLPRRRATTSRPLRHRQVFCPGADFR
jgi:hypothetical protein